MQVELFTFTHALYHKTSQVKKKNRGKEKKETRQMFSWTSWHVVCVTAKSWDADSVSVCEARSPHILGSALCQKESGACSCKWKTRGSPLVSQHPGTVSTFLLLPSWFRDAFTRSLCRKLFFASWIAVYSLAFNGVFSFTAENLGDFCCFCCCCNFIQVL